MTAVYVCLCNGYTDQDVRRAAASGHTTVDSAYESLGSGVCCGNCKCFAQDMIDETVTTAAAASELRPNN